MSERYSRLFLLPNNLYTEGSPVLISAGALLRDSLNGDVLVQLKFQNISHMSIKSVNVKVNAYDVTEGQLAGVEKFSYLDLAVLPYEEFGQSTPIHLPDRTTRSFSVEILAVVYENNEVFTPNAVSVAVAAPKDILEEVQRKENEKKAIKEEQEKDEMIKSNRYRQLTLLCIVSVLLVFLSIAMNSIYHCERYGEKIISVPQLMEEINKEINSDYSAKYKLALIIPCLSLLAAFTGKKNATITKLALFVCVALSTIQIICIVISFVYSTTFSWELANLLNQLRKYVNGVDYYDLRHLSWTFSADVRLGMDRLLMYIKPVLFAVLPNILCTLGLAIWYKTIE